MQSVAALLVCNKTSKVGTYLIRASQSYEHSMVLSVKFLEAGAQHILLSIGQDGTCQIELKAGLYRFKSIEDMIGYFKYYPLYLKGVNSPTTLADCVANNPAYV